MLNEPKHIVKGGEITVQAAAPKSERPPYGAGGGGYGGGGYGGGFDRGRGGFGGGYNRSLAGARSLFPSRWCCGCPQQVAMLRGLHITTHPM